MTRKEANGQFVPSSNLWQAYKRIVGAYTATASDTKDLAYWQGKLFTNFITYLFVLGLIALLPGVYLGFATGYEFVAIFDLVVYFGMAALIFNSKIGLLFKKILVLVVLYSLAIMLIFALGGFGPGNIYLLAIGILAALILPVTYSYWVIAINFIISFFFAFIIHYRLFNTPLHTEYNLASWLTVSSNLIFLSWMTILLINRMLRGLDHTQKKLKESEHPVPEKEQ